MAKKPTPKRKHQESRGRKRYSMFQFLARRRLDGLVNLVTCTNCREPHIVHHVCPKCGFYRGRQVIDMTAEVKEKITKISA